MKWKLADTRNCLRQLVMMFLLCERVDRCDRVVVSEPEYEPLTDIRSRFSDFLLFTPDLQGADLARDPSPMRDVSL